MGNPPKIIIIDFKINLGCLDIMKRKVKLLENSFIKGGKNDQKLAFGSNFRKTTTGFLKVLSSGWFLKYVGNNHKFERRLTFETREKARAGAECTILHKNIIYYESYGVIIPLSPITQYWGRGRCLGHSEWNLVKPGLVLGEIVMNRTQMCLIRVTSGENTSKILP